MNDGDSSGSNLSVGDEPFLNDHMINRQIFQEDKKDIMSKEKGKVINDFPQAQKKDHAQNVVQQPIDWERV